MPPYRWFSFFLQFCLPLLHPGPTGILGVKELSCLPLFTMSGAALSDSVGIFVICMVLRIMLREYYMENTCNVLASTILKKGKKETQARNVSEKKS